MKFCVGKNEIEIKQVEDSVFVNNIKFDTINDFVYFVNKLTDVAEEFLENEV